jgi:hypothetical protein
MHFHYCQLILLIFVPPLTSTALNRAQTFDDTQTNT